MRSPPHDVALRRRNHSESAGVDVHARSLLDQGRWPLDGRCMLCPWPDLRHPSAYNARTATTIHSMNRIIRPLPKSHRNPSLRRLHLSVNSKYRRSRKSSLSREKSNDGRFSAILAAATALLGVIIGGLFATWSTNQVNATQESSQHAQLEEQRTEQQRTLKREAYLGFLDSLNAYAAASEFESCAAISPERRPLYPACQALVCPTMSGTSH